MLAVPSSDRTSQLPAGPLRFAGALRAVRVVEAERFGQARLPLILLNFLNPLFSCLFCYGFRIGSDRSFRDWSFSERGRLVRPGRLGAEVGSPAEFLRPEIHRDKKTESAVPP